MYQSPSHSHSETVNKQNVWQKISESTGTLITPSNVIDAAAVVGAVYGIRNIDKPKGTLAVAASFGADAIDGPIARKTGTSSPLGEKIDAVGDKIKLGYAVLRLWQKNQADKPLLTSVAVQNTANAIITIADRVANDDPVLHSSKVGKRSFMTQEIGVGLNIVGKALNQRGHKRTGEVLRQTGNIVGFAGVGIGLLATKGYYDQVKSSTNKTSQDTQLVHVL